MTIKPYFLSDLINGLLYTVDICPPAHEWLKGKQRTGRTSRDCYAECERADWLLYVAYELRATDRAIEAALHEHLLMALYEFLSEEENAIMLGEVTRNLLMDSHPLIACLVYIEAAMLAVLESSGAERVERLQRLLVITVRNYLPYEVLESALIKAMQARTAIIEIGPFTREDYDFILARVHRAKPFDNEEQKP